jgi:hypothetical protein
VRILGDVTHGFCDLHEQQYLCFDPVNYHDQHEPETDLPGGVFQSKVEKQW